MAITSRQLAAVRRLERLALRKDGISITKKQAEMWCAVHVNEDWYALPVFLVSKGCNEDYSTWTEIAPDSVYEMEDTGLYVVMAEWWTSYQLWKRDWAKGTSTRPRRKIELYNEGEYCEDVIDGETCLDRYSNAPCNPCLRRIDNINSYKNE